MQIRIVDGQRATDRRGVAEYLGRSLPAVRWWAANRAKTGFPQPVDTEQAGRGVRARGEDGQPRGREWYALEDLDRFRETYLAAVVAAGKARVHSVTLDGDPDELLDAAQCAKVLQVEYHTFRSWVRDSKQAWEAGQAGYLPVPDEIEPYRRGVRRFWRRATIQSFINSRQGVRPPATAAEPSEHR
jgi:hypothetical protein